MYWIDIPFQSQNIKHYFHLQLFGMDFKVADRFTMEWEAELIRKLLAYAKELEDEQEGFRLHISVTRR